MAIVYQKSLFSWKDLDDLGDLERLKLVIDTMPDQKLIQTLHKIRGNGRNDHPITAMWNSVLAGIVYQHHGTQSLRRELSRNAQLRELCGFNPIKGAKAVPSKSAYHRFLKQLLKHKGIIESIFDELVNELKKVLPDFGKELAFDSKAISSLSSGKIGAKKGDGRAEHEADWGKKTYRGIKADGTAWEKVKSWFGFKLHLVVDANYELPVTMEVTKASMHDINGVKSMFSKLERTHPDILETCEIGIGDKGYDSTEMMTTLWDKYGIKPVIDIRNSWKDPDKTRNLPSNRHMNLTHNFRGNVYCHCPKTGEIAQMPYGGFEKDRDQLKYLCPAAQYGLECKGRESCPLAKGVRIDLEEDRRIFTPIARSSHRWKRIYSKRSSVERVNSRIHTSFGFEKHYIRGLTKMQLECSLALCVMLAMALGRWRQNNEDLIRSLVCAA